MSEIDRSMSKEEQLAVLDQLALQMAAKAKFELIAKEVIDGAVAELCQTFECTPKQLQRRSYQCQQAIIHTETGAGYYFTLDPNLVDEGFSYIAVPRVFVESDLDPAPEVICRDCNKEQKLITKLLALADGVICSFCKQPKNDCLLVSPSNSKAVQ